MKSNLTADGHEPMNFAPKTFPLEGVYESGCPKAN
jgi:hypothetical protein